MLSPDTWLLRRLRKVAVLIATTSSVSSAAICDVVSITSPALIRFWVWTLVKATIWSVLNANHCASPISWMLLVPNAANAEVDSAVHWLVPRLVTAVVLRLSPWALVKALSCSVRKA